MPSFAHPENQLGAIIRPAAWNGHTDLDLIWLYAAGVDPLDTQSRSDKGRPVPCNICRTPTWNQAGGCDLPGHYAAPAAALRALAEQNNPVPA